MENEGKIVIMIGIDNKLVGLIAVADIIKESAKNGLIHPFFILMIYIISKNSTRIPSRPPARQTQIVKPRQKFSKNDLGLIVEPLLRFELRTFTLQKCCSTN